MRAILERQGYFVEEALDGREALAKINRDGYDAILLDLMMPRLSGQDVIETLTRERPDKKCVIVVSAAAPSVIDRLAPTIVHARLRKPFDLDEMLAAVQSCVGEGG